MTTSRKTVTPMNVNLTKHSTRYSHAYTTNTALTFFHQPHQTTIFDFVIDSALEEKLLKCISNGGSGARSDFYHATYHQNQDDHSIAHEHLIKLTPDQDHYDHITPNELRCYLNGIREIQNEYGLCTDDQPSCILSEEGQTLVRREYKKFFDDLNSSAIPKNPTPYGLSYQIMQSTEATAKAWLYSGSQVFVAILLDHYFNPMLHDMGVSKALLSLHRAFIITSINAALLGITSSIPITLTVEIINQFFLSNQKNLSMDIKSRLITFIHVVNAYAQLDNFTAATLFGVATGGPTGASIAYQLIRILPKLRIEPEATHQPEVTTIVDRPRSPSPGLRHRTPQTS